MTASTTTSPTTHTLEVPGALLTYDVRRNDTSDEPVLFLIGSPMGAAGFGTLAGHFADRTVVTYDPRGAERSRRTDGAATSTPEEHGDDLHRVIAAARRRTGRPVRQQRRRRQRARAGRPPPGGRPHAGRARAAARRRWCPTASTRWRRAATSHDTYQRAGMGPAMAKFIAHRQPPGARSRPTTSQRPPRTRRCSACRPRTTARGTTCCSGRTCCPARHYEPDFDALRAAPTRIVVAVGRRVGGPAGPPRRGGRRRAARDDAGVSPATTAASWAASTARTVSPSAFAARLREVLGQA